MTVYLINISLILLEAGIFLGRRFENKNGKKIFCVLASLQWILISGLRHVSIGADTAEYSKSFYRLNSRSWSSVLSDFIDKYLYGTDIKDPGYNVLMKTFQIFSDNYQVFLLFIAVLFGALMGIWIYKYSSDPCISFIIYSCLFYSFFAITGHRQTIATALVVFIGYELIQKRKLIPFILLTLLASTIHISVLMFLPMYFLYDLKFTGTKLCIYGVIAISIPTILSNFLQPVTEIFGYDHYLEDLYVGGTYTYTFMLAAVLIAGILLRNTILQLNPRGNYALNATVWAVLFSLATFQVQGFMRIQQYYALFIMILVPDITECFEEKQSVAVKIAGIALLVLLLIRSNPQYMFFWQ